MIQRYIIYNSEPSDIGPHSDPHENGRWVEYNDVKKLEQDNEQLLKALGKSVRNSLVLKKKVNEIEEELAEVKAYFTDVAIIIDSSDGVAGWHLNGELASFEEVGILPLPELKESGVGK